MDKEVKMKEIENLKEAIKYYKDAFGNEPFYRGSFVELSEDLIELLTRVEVNEKRRMDEADFSTNENPC